MPQTPLYVRGVINLCGQVISVVDLRAKSAMNTEETTTETCIIVVETIQDRAKFNTGIVVDRVRDVLDITGAEAMSRMNTAIKEIQKSSDETANIIKVIDEIAFQTNLEALNATVEAARAGEAGRHLDTTSEWTRSEVIECVGSCSG